MSVTVKSGAPVPAWPLGAPERQPINADSNINSRQQTTTLIFKTHSPFCCGIAFVDPVGAKVIRDVEHAHIGISQVPQLLVGRVNVRTTVPGTAAAIENDQL